MSALGQKRTFAVQKVMSALPPKADMCGATRHVRYVPIADSCSATKGSLFDHLVGASEHRVRHGETKRLGRLQINRQIVLGWRLHRQVGRLLALENTIDVISRAPVLVECIGP